MYLGIDFLITHHLHPSIIEVNVGLPGGAHEYDLAHRVSLGSPSGIFEKIETTSRRVYGKAFSDYLQGLPFIPSLKPFKLWMDGMGPYPDTFHPGLRLEDKWNQYQVVSPLGPMPETLILDPSDLSRATDFLEKNKTLILKRRVGRGGRGLQKVTDPAAFTTLDLKSTHYLLQQVLESQVDGFNFSIRAVVFGGEFMCMYSNLSTRTVSNHGTLAFVSPGPAFGLAKKNFKTTSFNQKSWEATIWFGDQDPPYLKHNLYEETVAQTTLYLPEQVYKKIEQYAVMIERAYERLDLSRLPKACFEM